MRALDPDHEPLNQLRPGIEPAPQELPLTVMTSLLGVPFFLVLLRTPRRGRGR